MASKIDAPDSPKEDALPVQGEEKPASPSSTTSLPKDIRENKKIATPIIPSLNLGKNQRRIELEKQKVEQQNYIFNLNKRLGDSKGSIKRTQQYLAGLGGAYGQAQSLQDKDNARRLAESIKQAKSGLAVQDKQQKLLEHRILEAYKNLQEINDRIAHAQTHDKQSSTAATTQLTAAAGGFLLGRAIFNKIFKRKKKSSEQANVPEETTVQETPTTPGAQPATATTQPTGPIGQGIRVARWVAGSAVGVVSKTIEITGKGVQFAGKGMQAAGRAISVSLGSIPYVGIAFKALGIGISGAGKGVEVAGKGLESFGKSLGKIRQGLKMLKSVQLLAAATPVGAAVAIGARFKRLIAAAIAGLLYLLYLLGIKLLGMISGLAIGLVTGAPLLLLPAPIGIPLYIGYNAYWVYRGWNDPLGTYHLATHPTELITRPASWIKNQFSRFGGAAQSGTEATLGGIGNVTSSALSATGSFITGTASTLWGGIAGTFEGAISIGFSAIGSVMGTLAGSSGAIAGNLATVAVGGSVAAVAGVTIIGTIATNSAFYTPTLDPTEQFFPPGQNELFTITKTASETKLPNLPGSLSTEDVTFTVTVTAADRKLVNLKISDQITTSDGDLPGENTNTCKQELIAPGTIINAGGTWICTVVSRINYENNDSTVTNSATFTASTEDGVTTKSNTANATVIVGSVAEGCPSGWPTQHGSISQGIRGATSHHRLYPAEYAIDIGGVTTTNVPTFTTFAGKVIRVNQIDDNGYGIYVDIEGICGGSTFTARWAHLDSISAGIAIDAMISAGQQVGRVDSTGHVTGPHLHYSFFGLNMQSPNIPTTPPETCDGESACGVTW